MVMRFTACVPGQLGFRDLVGRMVGEVCRRVERDARCNGVEWRVMSAFNEAFNNIVEHAYAASPGDVEVTLMVENDRLVLHLTDRGQGFNFDDAGAHDQPPEFDTLSEGGMGLFIIRRAMSEVFYERRQDRNLLTMVRSLDGCGEIEGGSGARC